MRRYNITWEGIDFVVTGAYIPEEPTTYDYPGSDDCFEVWSIHIGDACVDFMLTEQTIADLEKEILETYYR